MVDQRNLDVKEAVRRATDVIQELYADRKLEGLLLEEVQFNPSGSWDVTLGFTRPGRTMTGGALSNVLPAERPRAYKRVKIDAQTGEFVGMTDRDLED